MHGEFIADLVGDFVYGFQPMSISPFGNDRAALSRLNQNQTNIGEIDMSSSSTSHLYQIAAPTNPANPLVLFEGSEPNFDDLFGRYPQTKFICITFEAGDSARIRGNNYFQTTAEFYDPTKTDPSVYGWMTPWNTLKANYESSLTNITVPAQLPASVGEVALTAAIEPTGVHAEGYAFPSAYTASITTIKMSDILTNSSTVLTTLAAITSGTITTEIQDKYAQYITAQANLVTTYMPWVTQ
jgi:hypothetical protein